MSSQTDRSNGHALDGARDVETPLPRIGWLAFALIVLDGGFMLFDGTRALFVGSFITAHGGELGPWATMVAAAGIDPRSTLMMLVVAGYGLVYLMSGAALILELPLAWWIVLGASILGLWYVPFGTAINLGVIGLLVASPLRRLAS